ALESLPDVHQSNEDRYTISGEADPGTLVTITVRDDNNKTVTKETRVDKAGNFNTNVSLTDLTDGTLLLEILSTHISGGTSEIATASIQKVTPLDQPPLSVSDRITTNNFPNFSITGTAKAGATILLSVTDSVGLEKTLKTTVNE